MNIKEMAHTSYAGLIITSLDEGDVTALTSDYLLNQLRTHGYLILRGFRHSIADFSERVRSTSSRISLDPARSFDGDTAQKVDAGYDKVGLHCENGNSPFWPDLCWFYCQKAPTQGSQTTVCDGKAVYEKMNAAQRAAFTSQDIVYSRRVDEKKWKTYALHALAGQPGAPTSIDDITLEHLYSVAQSDVGMRIDKLDDGAIRYSFQTPAIIGSRLNTKETHNFANSIFGPSNNYETPVITFADGNPIPDTLLAEMDDLCESLTFDVGWQQGDIVLIDNTRVMHGRRRIEDKDRTIFNALSYV
ncbi:TauD/TfdA family dioxygenase [Dickeya zeae]|uniref:Taurine catabolism dioxygenase TauD/TfdA n=1 Tax=Dickeya zeae (strain Ech586) TaxID=590409 RepID=D2C2H3_DICZ5|nr:MULTISPECIES: TauD/TfdA family dioxygenase [Dickeya]ACZ77337.1 taurine catabolism dioxygenase TauD/TfdA [Dickeya parazeae Ech586]UCZ75690.1 TauD/TfdA family dioxygenase [Dickeya zeae]